PGGDPHRLSSAARQPLAADAGAVPAGRGRRGLTPMRRLLALVLLLLAPGLAAAGEDRVQGVHFPTASAAPGPLQLEAYLRQPDGAGPFAAVVLLHACAGVGGTETEWAHRLTGWSYVTLVVDSYGPRDIAGTCDRTAPPERAVDAYGALDFLA